MNFFTNLIFLLKQPNDSFIKLRSPVGHFVKRSAKINKDKIKIQFEDCLYNLCLPIKKYKKCSQLTSVSLTYLGPITVLRVL